MHMLYWIEIVTLTEIPIQETVEGGMWSLGLLWKRRQQRKQGGWEQTRPSRQDIHGSASKPKALWCLICPAEVDWACSCCSETSKCYTEQALDSQQFFFLMETSLKAACLLRTVYKIM